MKTSTNIKSCATCALRSPTSECRILHKPTNAHYICPQHIPLSSYHTCHICGHLILSDAVLLEKNSEWRYYCKRCAKALETCATCSCSNLCDFQTNPSPIPPTIRKTIRQGNMTIQKDEINPERVAITCQKNCKCFSEEFGCKKQNLQYCENWREINEV